MRIVEDGEIQFRGPSLTPGYWNDPEATKAAFTEDGWYMSGDLGAYDEQGRLHLHGRKKDIIVLPNGFNVFPEDLENALRVAGIRDSVAIETRPGRIEAVVLAPGTHAVPGDPRATPGIEAASPEEVRREIDAAVKAANGRSGRTSGSPAGASGRRPTSRAPTPSRSSATVSARGPRSTIRCR